jgi:hypothetical protein
MVAHNGGGRSIYGNELIAHGRLAVATAGTELALTASNYPKASGVYIKAMPANTGLVYVGGDTVTSSTGYPLSAGETLFLPIAQTTTIFVDSAVNGEGVAYFVV